MSEIKSAILETHCAVQRVRSISASSRPARDVAAAAGQLARAASRLEASATASAVQQLDPVDAVRMVVEAAIRAGADWQQVVATVNKAGMIR